MPTCDRRVLAATLGALLGASSAGAARAIPPSGAVASATPRPGLPASAAPPAPAQPRPPAGARHPDLPRADEATNSCVGCHATLTDQRLRDPATAYRTSAHGDDRIGCVGCHQGDPRDPTVGAHAKLAGFQAHPTHAEIPAVCDTCHGDPGFMRHLNARLPVGQAALFGQSVHGGLSGAGDAQAPTCTDCHGTHDITGPSSPRSPVNRRNVASLCGKCHSDPKRMSRYGMPSDEVARWEASVHGEAFRKGSERAPTCTGCHGAHAPAPSEASSVTHACDRCHDDEAKYFEQSPHSKAFRRRGLSGCVLCHGTHDIAPPTALLVGTGAGSSCMKCHSHDDGPRRVAETLSASLRDARGRVAELRGHAARARESGMQIAGISFALDRVATEELRLRGAVHTLDPARLEAPLAAVSGAVADAEGLVTAAERAHQADRRGYYLALALAGVLLVGLLLKSRDLDRMPAP